MRVNPPSNLKQFLISWQIYHLVTGLSLASCYTVAVKHPSIGKTVLDIMAEYQLVAGFSLACYTVPVNPPSIGKTVPDIIAELSLSRNIVAFTTSSTSEKEPINGHVLSFNHFLFFMSHSTLFQS